LPRFQLPSGLIELEQMFDTNSPHAARLCAQLEAEQIVKGHVARE